MQFKNPEAQVARWIEVLGTYEFDIQHRLGRLHGNADALSRKAPCNGQNCHQCQKIEANHNEKPVHVSKRKQKVKAIEQEFSQPERSCCSTSVEVNSNTDNANSDNWVETMSKADIRAAQMVDPEIRKIIEFKEKSSDQPPWSDISIESIKFKRYWSMWSKLVLIDGVLYLNKSIVEAEVDRVSLEEESNPTERKIVDKVAVIPGKIVNQDKVVPWNLSNSGHDHDVYDVSTVSVSDIDLVRQSFDAHQYVLVLPVSFRKGALRQLHDAKICGHLGVHKTLQRVKERYYWVGMTLDVKEWVKNCNACQRKSPVKKSSRAPMKQYTVGAPMERVAVDILGPLPETDRGNKYVLCVGDYFTKWVTAIAIPNQEAETVAAALVENVFCKFGLPRQLHSDQGRNFESKLFQEVCKLLNIDKTRTTGYRPQGDGMIERFMRTVSSMLRHYVKQTQDDWDEQLQYVLMAYNSAEHVSSGYSPFEMTFGRSARLPVEMLYGSPPSHVYESESEYVESLQNHLEVVHEFARNNLRISSEKHKKLYDLKSDPDKYEYKVGDLVWYHNSARKPGVCPKLIQNWHGPYVVIEVISDVLYRIQLQHNLNNRNRNRKIVVNTDKLKKYLSPVDVDVAIPRPSKESKDPPTLTAACQTKSGRESRKPKWFGVTL
jgi:hypothetical protein